jgi:hypothetical protein
MKHPDFEWFTQCVTYSILDTYTKQVVYAAAGVVIMYAFPLVTIVYCYTAIILEICRRAVDTGGELQPELFAFSLFVESINETINVARLRGSVVEMKQECLVICSSMMNMRRKYLEIKGNKEIILHELGISRFK